MKKKTSKFIYTQKQKRMEKNEQNENLVIDVDRVIQKYNEKNPNLKRMDRTILAEKLGVNKQVFTDWKSGKTPKIIDRLFKLMAIGDCKLDDFIISE